MNDRETQNQKIREIWAELARRAATSPGEPCPDAEILAAYSERMLSDAEMSRLEAHFSVCAACQETLAALMTSEETSSAMSADSRSAPVQIESPKSPVRTIPTSIITGGRAGSPSTRRSVWPWLAPAMAAGILLAVWLGVKQRHPAPVAPVDIAQYKPVVPDNGNQSKRSESKATDTATPREQAAVESHLRNPDLRKPESRKSAPRNIDSIDIDSEKTRRSGSGELMTPRSIAPPKTSPSADTKSLSAQAASRETFRRPAVPGSAGAAGAIVNPSATAEAQATVSSTVAVAAPQASQAQKNDAARNTVTRSDDRLDQSKKPQILPAPEPTREQNKALEGTQSSIQEPNKSQTNQIVLVAPQNTEVAGNRPARVLPGDAKNKNAIVLAKHELAIKIFAPDGQNLWIVGRAGMIQHSTNGGVSVTTQNSGVSADLLAGSAPRANVCWVVGRAGTILLTTDADHWRRIGAPGDQDWVGVRATDALHAIIWDTGQRATFSTEDGGATWTSMRTSMP